MNFNLVLGPVMLAAGWGQPLVLSTIRLFQAIREANLLVMNHDHQPDGCLN